MDILGSSEFAEVRLGIYGLETHPAHEPPDPLCPNDDSERQEKLSHLANSFCRVVQMMLIHFVAYVKLLVA